MKTTFTIMKLSNNTSGITEKEVSGVGMLSLKYWLIFLLLPLFYTSVNAQQVPVLTQYAFNPFIINPALAGTNDYYQVRSSHRLQWLGFKDGPITNCISAYGPHPSKKYDMGFGGTIISDITGPTSKNELLGSYAYNIPINKEIRLSMGLSLGLMQYKLDQNAIILNDESGSSTTDPVMQNSSFSSIAPDASVGFYLYSTTFNVGLAATQLFNNKVKTSDTKDAFNQFRTHIYLTGSYTYFINREFKLEPNAVINWVYPVLPQLDLNCRVFYQNTFWGGLSFRTSDAISIMFGYIHEKKIYIGYSCDFAINGISKYGLTSHELMIGYRFSDIKKH